MAMQRVRVSGRGRLVEVDLVGRVVGLVPLLVEIFYLYQTFIFFLFVFLDVRKLNLIVNKV